MSNKVEINGVTDAIVFAISGFSIVFLVLLLVIISIVLILKIEKVLTRTKKHSDDIAEETEEALDPLVLVLISAAVGAVYGNIQLRRVRRIGSDVRHAGAWGREGRTIHQGSHSTKKL